MVKKNQVILKGKFKTQIAPARVVEMWFMGSRMLLDMGTCRGALQFSGGSSSGGCRSIGLSDSSVLFGWIRDRD